MSTRNERSVRYGKWLREKARREGKSMFCLAVCGDYRDPPHDVSVEYIGACEQELVEEIMALINKHLAREKR